MLNSKWITDITEFYILVGKAYLSPIIDCFDWVPVSWTIGTSPNAELVNTMLDRAVSVLEENEKTLFTLILDGTIVAQNGLIE